jgi:hypothetical protein
VKPTDKKNWLAEDLELDREFSDVSSKYARVAEEPPPVPHHIDRLVHGVAHQNAFDSLQRNWLLGNGPQVALAAMIFFAIGILTVYGLRTPTDTPLTEVGPAAPVVTTAKEATSATSGTDVLESDMTDFNSIILARQRASTSGPAESGKEPRSWVRVAFSVDAAGRAEAIRVIERCVRPSAGYDCMDDDVYDQWALDHIRQKRFKPTAQVQELILLP